MVLNLDPEQIYHLPVVYYHQSTMMHERDKWKYSTMQVQRGSLRRRGDMWSCYPFDIVNMSIWGWILISLLYLFAYLFVWSTRRADGNGRTNLSQIVRLSYYFLKTCIFEFLDRVPFLVLQVAKKSYL
mmetsp:Transcript_12636/g.23689  ORF Transcript_12636/g.23689 Transcript_12636/m.23689 type:complete len:128 (+) Transcript_12636:564-947(+)